MDNEGLSSCSLPSSGDVLSEIGGQTSGKYLPPASALAIGSLRLCPSSPVSALNNSGLSSRANAVI